MLLRQHKNTLFSLQNPLRPADKVDHETFKERQVLPEGYCCAGVPPGVHLCICTVGIAPHSTLVSNLQVRRLHDFIPSVSS